MPYYRRSYPRRWRRYRSAFRKYRSYKRRYNRYREGQWVGRSMVSVVPDQKLVRLQYCDYYNKVTNFTAGNANVHTFRANSIYDPDYTGTGHQPFYHDELAQLYSNYVVIGFKATFVVSSTVQIGVAVHISTTTTPLHSTGVALREDPLCYAKQVSPVTGKGVTRITYSCAPCKYLGEQNPTSLNSGVVAAFGASPLREVYLHYSDYAATSSESYQMQLNFEYLVLCLSPINFAPS